MKIVNISNRIIEYSFYLLLFFVPLILTPMNYELFEYNKMMLTYVLTVIIVGAWLIKMVVNKKVEIQRTPLDIPLLLFFVSQVVSTVFSLDRHVSIWGYYSRFHGGLLSSTAYLLLYYAFVSNLDKQKVLTGLRFGLLSGFLVAGYGVAEHFGIDAQYWVQDVKNRVFSTLGQPNWLAAYLSVLTPIVIALGVRDFVSQIKIDKEYKVLGIKYDASKRKIIIYTLYLILASLYYLALLYTKSRSGFLGFWSGNLIFWGILFLHFRKQILKWFLILNSTFLILNFFIGSPFEQISKYFSFTAIKSSLTHEAPPPPLPPQAGGTESGEIRRIVWKGAVDVWRHYPLFGSGVETFAFSYYQYRPVEHNMVSEWDFLYNKAHNEYLNYLATTGILGFGAYLAIILSFAAISIKYYVASIKQKIHDTKYLLLTTGLFASYTSILVSNFFGFSVVIIGIFFFLIPAFTFILTDTLDQQKTWAINFGYISDKKQWSNLSTARLPAGQGKADVAMQQLSPFQWIIVSVIILSTLYLILYSFRLWWADVNFARGYNLNRIEDYNQAYDFLKQAVEINPSEPLYRNELAVSSAMLALAAAQEKEATRTAFLIQEAVVQSQKALEISPRNVNLWKDRVRIFYALSPLDEEYLKEALEAIQVAKELAPTDAKVSYNLAVLYGQTGEKEMAVETLEETIRLKPDYRDARYGLALFYAQDNQIPKAVEQLEYSLKNIASSDAEVQKLLEELKR